MLIFRAKPYATHVMGFHQWKQWNRLVNKGATAAPIIVPKTVKDETTPDGKRTFFSVSRTIFDVTDTHGDDLPHFDPPPPLCSEGHEAAFNLIRQITEADFNIPVEITPTPGALGWFITPSRTIQIDPGTGYGEHGIRCLVHELAHGLTTDLKAHTKEAREVIADAAAYFTLDHLGFDVLDACAAYIAIYGEKGDFIRKHLPQADKISKQITAAVDAYHHAPEAIAA